MKLAQINSFKKVLEEEAEKMNIVLDKDSFEFEKDRAYVYGMKIDVKIQITVYKKTWEHGLYIEFLYTKDFKELGIARF